ncbi:hypothetical protein [Vreelandella utahensis]|uniref:hypothetical protein n=1 Tax=Vreelandella halophila TaxID=86177 RepID=UPI00098464CF|nr:hypothetical protein [Halomonas utahensis]
MRRHQVLLLAILILPMAGCSLVQPENEPPTEAEADVDCEWTAVRGVAELIETVPDSERARFRFYPGDTEFSASMADSQARKGDEFKVVLEIPDPISCGDPRVQEMQPLEPTD